MPSKRVVPKKLRVPEWHLSSFMMNRALEAVVRQIKMVDRRHDIPYLAGYSKNGKTIYIDRGMPKLFRFRGRRIKIDRFLILHEAVEKTLMDHLLILDDWGLAPLTPDQGRDLLEIVDDRHNRGSTIVTSQLPVDHWHE